MREKRAIIFKSSLLNVAVILHRDLAWKIKARENSEIVRARFPECEDQLKWRHVTKPDLSSTHRDAGGRVDACVRAHRKISFYY